MTDTRSLCSGTNKRGLRCGSRAVQDGLCRVHAGLVDMKELGAAGGRASVRSRLGVKDEDATPDLRERAKTELERMLVDPDTSDSVKAGIAKALYAYAPQTPPVARAEFAAEMAGARERLAEQLNRIFERSRETQDTPAERERRLDEILDELPGLLTSVRHKGGLTLADIAAKLEEWGATPVSEALKAENERLRRRVHELEADGGGLTRFDAGPAETKPRPIEATSGDGVDLKPARVGDPAEWPPSSPSGMASDSGLRRLKGRE